MILKNGKRLDGCSDTVPIGTLNPFLGSVAPYGYLICEGQLVSKTTYKELYEICGDTFGTGTETEFYLPDLRGKTIVGYKEGDSTFGTLGGLLGALSNKYIPKGKNTGTAVILNDVSLFHSGGAVGNHTLTTSEIPAHTHGSKSLTGTVWNMAIQSASTNLGFSGIARASGKVEGVGYATSTISSTPDGFTIDATHTHDSVGGGGGHNHGFTQPSAHSFTPTTKSITQPTFTGTEEDISTLQPTIVMNWIVKAFITMPNQSYVSNHRETSDTNTYSCNYINDLKTLILDMSHPIGSYYWSSDSTNPNLLFGGEWEQIKDKFVIAVGDSHEAGKSYGSNTKNLSHTHTTNGYALKIAEIPSHSHYTTFYNDDFSNGGDSGHTFEEKKNSAGLTYDVSYMSGAWNKSTSDTGSGQAHSHGDTGTSLSSTFDVTPACEAAYCWKRIG